jgi:G3E family GTPase
MLDSGFPRIPVHILSGFLGVGKTTALRDLLTRRADKERIAVVLNEFGTLGVDGALLSDCASCVLKEVTGGCVCCTAMADLEASVEEILDLVAPTRFVVEPTGLASPAALVDLFRRQRFAERLELRPVITLLDPQQDYRAAYAEGGLFRDQIDLGDVLVINRCDLAGEAEIRAAEAFAAELRPPKLAVVRASHGNLPARVFDMPFPTERELERNASGTVGLLPSLSGGKTRARGSSAEGYTGHGFARGPDRLFDAERLEAFLAALEGGTLGLAGSVARAKGIFRTTSGWRAHEIAGGRATTAATAYRRDSRFDVILKRPGSSDFDRIDQELEEILVPEGAPVLTIEGETEALNAFDARALEALAARTPGLTAPDGNGAAYRLGPLLLASGAPQDAPWLWLISEGGLFGSGGPREVLERGVVTCVAGEAPGFQYVLADGAAGGAEADFDTCREIPNLCAIRLAPLPGGPPSEGDEP